MPPIFVDISDADDPRVADYRRLNDAAHRRQIEGPTSFGHGFFVIEGWLATEQAIATRQPLRSVLVASARRRRAADLLSRTRTPPCSWRQPTSSRRSSGSTSTAASSATADRRLPLDPDTVAARATRLVVLEGVNDAENLGVVFRNAAGLGAGGVLLDPTCCDPLARRTVRVSLGHVLSVPWARMAWPDGLDRIVKARGFELVALTPLDGATDLARRHGGGRARGRDVRRGRPGPLPRRARGRPTSWPASPWRTASTRSTSVRPRRSPCGSFSATDRGQRMGGT